MKKKVYLCNRKQESCTAKHWLTEKEISLGDIPDEVLAHFICGNSSVGRAQPCQGWGREFESRFTLTTKNILSPSGGIGRRARFRCVCREACRFDSCPGHQQTAWGEQHHQCSSPQAFLIPNSFTGTWKSPITEQVAGTSHSAAWR